MDIDEEDLDTGHRFAMPRLFVRRIEVLRQQVIRERSEAVDIVARLLRETRREDIPTLAGRPELRTFGVLERLISTGSAELARDPQYALLLAQLAVSVSKHLPAGAYYDSTRAQARGRVWNALGKTLSFLGRADESVEAFERAQTEVADPGLDYDRAIIRFDLSIAYQRMDRHDEARALLPECQEVFRRYGNTRMAVLAGLEEGHLLQRLRLHREAREVCLRLLPLQAQIEAEHLAALHKVIGLCSIELGDYEDAERYLTNAVTIHQQLRQPLDAARTEQALGRLLIRRGSYHDGIARLRPARHQFLKHWLAEEAGLCGLDMVEGLLLAGDLEPADRLVRTIANEFLAAGLSSRAVTALRYLSDAITARQASAEMAVEVREYVISLRTTPERELPPLLPV